MQNRTLAEAGETPQIVLVMVSYAFVDGFTRVAREEAIERLKRAIATSDGVITDFAFAGREAMRLTVEVDAAGLSALRDELDAAEIELFPRSATELDGARTMNAHRPLLAMLHVSFLDEDVAPQEFAPASAHA